MIYFREYGPTLLDSCYLFIHLADVIQSDLEQMSLIRCPAGRGSAPFSGRLTGGLCTLGNKILGPTCLPYVMS